MWPINGSPRFPQTFVAESREHYSGSLDWPREFEFGQHTHAVAIDFLYQMEIDTMRFPNTEGEIGKLAQFMISGLTSNQELFPTAGTVRRTEDQVRDVCERAGGGC